jgi:hypothetical protein
MGSKRVRRGLCAALLEGGKSTAEDAEENLSKRGGYELLRKGGSPLFNLCVSHVLCVANLQLFVFQSNFSSAFLCVLCGCFPRRPRNTAEDAKERRGKLVKTRSCEAATERRSQTPLFQSLRSPRVVRGKLTTFCFSVQFASAFLWSSAVGFPRVLCGWFP